MSEVDVSPLIKAALTLESNNFLCHNCSDLNLESGESCFFVVFEPYKKEDILHGVCPCIMGKPCESDFYLLEGKVAKERYQDMKDNPLWFVNSRAMFKTEEELREIEASEEKILKLRCDARARRDIQARIEAFDYISFARPCTIETDPLRSRWVK